ncbi:MAG: hypothetical protein GF353_07900 [Candidatus Lokiarchaeota archaeon]|nr:hypothetical protein [Candidatus Lokiarchaeota archaeon]
MIHSIQILRKSGEPIFTKFFDQANSWNENLTGGLISALYHFTDKLFGSKIEDIEIESYRLLLETDDEINLIFVVIFDKYDSSVNIKKILGDLKGILITEYKEVLEKNLCTEDDFEGLDQIIDVFISSPSKIDPMEILKPRYIKILKDFRTKGEILDCDLISLETGGPIMHEWKQDFLDMCLRQIDAFYKSAKNLNLTQIILSYTGRHLILYKVSDILILTALLNQDVSLGLGTLLIENVAKKIAKIG